MVVVPNNVLHAHVAGFLINAEGAFDVAHGRGAAAIVHLTALLMSETSIFPEYRGG